MIWRGAIAAAALLVAAPALAATAKPGLSEQLAAFQALDGRVQSAACRLVRGNAPYCRDVAPGIGLVLFDAAGFSDPKAVRDALGLSRDVAVGAVAVDSPAARAGLRAAQPLSAVADHAVGALPSAGPNDYARLTGLHDRVDASLRATGTLNLTDAPGSAISISGEPTCVSRFELLSSGSKAAADGKRVVVGRKLVEALPEDDLLAAALAHELAHNLLGHRARLDASGRSWGKVRVTEREADRLSVWLLANAGYDPQAAVRFFERWGPKFDLGLFAAPDHDGWKARVRAVAAEIVVMNLAMASSANGQANWARDFRPAS